MPVVQLRASEMKWLLFAVSLFTLWVAFNALFMASGRYHAFNFEVAGIGIALGVMTAWLSSKKFMRTERETSRGAAVLKAPPVLFCIFILLLFCAMGALKVVAYR